MRFFVSFTFAGLLMMAATVSGQDRTAYKMPQAIIFKVPGSTHTLAKGINNAGDVFGQYEGSFLGRASFIRNGEDGTFVTLNITDVIPTATGGGNVIITGMNDEGYAAGNIAEFGACNPYRTGCQVIWTGSFVRDPDGHMDIFNPFFSSGVLGINSARTVFGTYYDGVKTGSFIRDRDGHVTTFDGVATAINDKDEVAGMINGQGFFRSRNGDVTLFGAPNAAAISFGVQGIDGLGDILGTYNIWGGQSFLFLRSKQGRFTVFTGPSSQIRQSGVLCVNNRGDVGGYTALDNNVHPDSTPIEGFIRDKQKGSFEIVAELNFTIWPHLTLGGGPGEGILFCGLNNSGQFVGTTLQAGVPFGFLRNSN
jgi:hypothetical protein